MSDKFPSRIYVDKTYGTSLENSRICSDFIGHIRIDRSDIEYISLEEHEAILKNYIWQAEEAMRMANSWMADYDKLKAKYEPSVIVPSDY